MLFDEPMATQGFRTTGNDPLNQFASWYQFGQNLRQSADARRARKEAQEMARAEAEKAAMEKANNTPMEQGSIGANANGVFGVSGTSPQQSGGIGVDASGVHGVEQPTTGSYGNFTGQIPNSPYTVNNSSTLGGLLGGDLGKLVTTSGLDLLKGLKGGGNADNSMNITNQTIGQNYNNRIDGQVGGLNIPRTPQQNGFGTAISNAENPLNSFTGGSVANFLNPVSSGDSAQVAGGATNLSADNPFARSSKYLGADYDKMAYVKSALDNGVKNPLVAMVMYDQMIAPLRESAREDELRNAFFVLQSPEASIQDKMNAISLIQYYKKDPYMAENQDWSREERDMKRKRFGWDEEMFEARKANGFLPLRGGGRVGRPSGSGNSVGRTPKIKGFDQSLLDEDMIDSLKSFKADSTSAENFDNMIGNMRALKARLMQERGLSDEDAGAFVGSVLKKSLGTTYYKLPQKQKTFLMNSFSGIDSYGEKPTAQERKLAGQGYLDAFKKAAGEKFDKLIKNGDMQSFENNQPSGAVIDGVYYSDQTLENLAKEKARLEQAVKDGTFGYYGENGFGAMPKGESTKRAQELQNEDILDEIEETDRWKEALRSLI